MTRADRRLPARRLAVAALVAALVPMAAFVLLEGGSSAALFARALASREPEAPLARLRHTRYDPDLGWSHQPGVRIDDLYGPGAWLQINVPEPGVTLGALGALGMLALCHGLARRRSR